LITTIHEHTFFRGPLREHACVLDLGANRGAFARAVTARFPVTCVAVEPTDELARGISGDRIRVRRAAIARERGPLQLFVTENPEASSVVVGDADAIRTEEVPGIPLGDLLAEEQLSSVALAKVDIEGGERDMFLGTDDEVLRRVAQFSVEFHIFTGALTEADVKAIRAWLHRIGFEAIRFSAGHHNWLFFQPNRCRVRQPEIVLTRHLIRPARGAAIRAARHVSRSVFEGH
jgi:FkbM family methyltransferase